MFRSLSYKLHVKKDIPQVIDNMYTADKAEIETSKNQLLIEFHRQSQEEKKDGLVGQSYMENIKKRMDEIILREDFKRVKYYVVETDKIPEFMYSDWDTPLLDFGGNQIQKLDTIQKNKRFTFLSYSLIKVATGGAFIVSWLGDNDIANEFVESIHSLADEDFVHSLVRFSFEFVENIYISPMWWDSLKEDERIDLFERADRSSTRLHRPSSMHDDGKRLVSWKVINRYTNISHFL